VELVGGFDLVAIEAQVFCPPVDHFGNQVESPTNSTLLSAKWEIKPKRPSSKHLRLSDADKKILQDDVSGDSATAWLSLLIKH